MHVASKLYLQRDFNNYKYSIEMSNMSCFTIKNEAFSLFLLDKNGNIWMWKFYYPDSNANTNNLLKTKFTNNSMFEKHSKPMYLVGGWSREVMFFC